MEKLKGWKKMNFLKKTFLGIGVLLMALLFCFGLNQNGEVQAAVSGKLSINGVEFTEDEYKVTSTQVNITFIPSEDIGAAACDWRLLSIDGGNAVEIKSGKNEKTLVLNTIDIGSNIVQLYIDGNLVCEFKVSVDSLIRQDNFTPVGGIDGNEEFTYVLLLKEKGLQETLELMIENVTGVTWATIDGGTEIVTVGEKDGIVTAVGAGRTTIVAKYPDPSDPSKSKTTTAEVFVAPQVSYEGTTYNPGRTIEVTTGKYLYPGISNEHKQQKIKEKIEWKIEKDGVIVSQSSDAQLDYLICENNGNDAWWVIDAEAGDYDLTVATVGCLNANNVDLKKKYTLRVYATGGDKKYSLQVGDEYDLAKAFNVRTDEFLEYFQVVSVPSTNVEDKYKYYNYCEISDGGVIKVTKATKEVIIKFTVEKSEYMAPDTQGNKPTEIIVTLVAYEEFKLNHSEIILSVKDSIVLAPLYDEVEYADKESFVWEYGKKADSTYIELDQNGKVTGKKATPSGEPVSVVAKMTLRDGRIVKAKCVITVVATPTALKLDPTSKEIEVDESFVLKVTPEGADTSKLKWLNSDDSVISIDVVDNKKSATVTGLKAGKAVITIVSENNFIAGYCEVVVMSPIEKLEITNAPKEALPTYYKIYRLEVSYEPKTANITDLEWESKNPEVAWVDKDGVVHLESGGETTIYVSPKHNPHRVQAYCRIEVLEEATSVGIDVKDITVDVGNSKELKYTVNTDSSSTKVKWWALDTNIVSFEKPTTTVKNGEEEKQYIEGKKVGQTYIVAQTDEGHIATCLVTVTQTATGVTVEPTTIKIAVGETYQLTAKSDPADATDKSFKWTSLDDKIASVDNAGKVTGKGAGTTQITVLPPKGGAPAVVVVTVYDKATGMTLNQSSVTIVKGETFTLKPVFTPSNVTNKNVKWTSLNEKIATISKEGKIKGIKGGTTVITAVSEDGGYVATCVVTVTERITSVKLNKSEVVVGVGKTYKLKATVKSNSASNPKVKWITSNKKIVKVSKNGNIRGVKVGTATITVKVTDGTNKKATCKVRVVRPVTKVTLNKKVLNIVVGQTGTLKATVKPSNATIKTVKWSSGDSTIAEVDQDGTIFGLSLGQTKVTATAKDNSGKKASCYVNVIEEIPASSIVLSAKSLTLVKGDSEKIGYSIVPRNNTDKVFFDSDNRAVATVNGSGKVYGKRAGVANITISTTSGKQATVKVTVLGLNKTKLTMEQYDTETLFIDGTTTGITWFTSNPSVATVQQGKVVARKAGKCAIYAKVNGISLKCNVVVKKINK